MTPRKKQNDPEWFSTTDVAKRLGVCNYRIWVAKSDNLHRLKEGIHWRRQIADYHIRLYWSEEGIKWLKQYFDRVAAREAKQASKPKKSPLDDQKVLTWMEKLKPSLQQLMTHQSEGKNKWDCISLTWGISKGGGKKSIAASLLYDQVLKANRK